jgi:NADH dehydrogenase FAD-containing subunit
MGSLLGVSDRMARVRELSRYWMPVGKRVAVIGGGLVGVELAGFLADRGRDVSVLEETPTLAVEMALPRRWRVLHELREHGVAMLTEARVEAIADDGVVYSRDGERRTLPADTVILATGVRDNPGLAEALAGLCATVHLVGDCRAVGYLEGALMDAARIARTI